MSQNTNSKETSGAAGDRVIIFDTTLRDGEQSPGASMNLQEKLRIAEVLERMGVEVISRPSIELLGASPDQRFVVWRAPIARILTEPPRLWSRRAASESTPSSPPAPCT